jgi:PPOX class probable F420-dependent enzyme
MAITLSDAARALFDGKNFATVATINPDGSPQTSVVWVRRDGDEVLFSTVRGRRKERNLARDSRVSLALYDQENPYRHVEIRGTASISEVDGRALIDELAVKYTGKEYPGEPADRVRVVVRITPAKVTGL